jgi:hypothetical protein
VRAPPAGRRLVKSVAYEDLHHGETVDDSYHAEAHGHYAHADTHTHAHDADTDAHADPHHGDADADTDHTDTDANATPHHGNSDGDEHRHGGRRPRSGDRLDGSDHRQLVRRGAAVAAEPRARTSGAVGRGRLDDGRQRS